jgi:hypothetical protein
LAKLFRAVDDHLTLIPTKEANVHNYFKRNISDIFKLSNYFFKLNKISYARDNPKAAVQHFFFFQFNMTKFKTPRIQAYETLNNIYQRYVTERILFSEHVKFWITNILEMPTRPNIASF